MKRLLIVLACSASNIACAQSEASCSLEVVGSNDIESPAIASSLSDITVLIDTGSGVTLIPRSMASDPPISSENAATFYSPITINRHSIRSMDKELCQKLEISPYTVKEGQSKHPIESVVNDNILLGRDALSQLEFSYDAVNKTVKLTEHTQNQNTRDRRKWPYIVGITIGGSRFGCLLDTGFSQRASVYVPHGSNLHGFVTVSKQKNWNSSHPVSPSGRVIDTYFNNAKIDGLSGSGVVFSIEPPGSRSTKTDLSKLCVVGNGLLKYAKMNLKPDEQFVSLSGTLPDPEYNRWGIGKFTYNKETKEFVVSDLKPDFSAFRSGLRNGDVLRSFNGSMLLLDNVSELRKLAFAPTGTQTLLEVGRLGENLEVNIINREVVHVR